MSKNSSSDRLEKGAMEMVNPVLEAIEDEVVGEVVLDSVWDTAFDGASAASGVVEQIPTATVTLPQDLPEVHLAAGGELPTPA